MREQGGILMSLSQKDTTDFFDLRDLIVCYQPFINSLTGSVAGLEAIIQINNGVSIATEINRFRMLNDKEQIIRIGRWSVKTVCEQIAGLRDATKSVVPIMLSALPEQLNDDLLIPVINSSLVKVQLPAKFLELAFSEALVIQNFATIEDMAKKLNSIRIPITITEFGIDLSIFRLIRYLPITNVMLHKSLVRQIGRSNNAEMYLRLLSSRLIESGITFRAARVSTNAQELFLASIGCNTIQYSTPALPSVGIAKLF
jgi:EAL domain-containing protein (putative c-di-GMP-specific phosphodiesterase class I)